MIRVLAFGSGNPSLDVSQVVSVHEIGKSKSPTGLDNIEEVATELVVLSTGRVVPADSEDARAERDAQRAVGTRPVVEAEAHHTQEESQRDPNDPVHKVYQDLGLSKRAWSKSPSTSPSVIPTPHYRGISDVSDAPVRA